MLETNSWLVEYRQVASNSPTKMASTESTPPSNFVRQTRPARDLLSKERRWRPESFQNENMKYISSILSRQKFSKMWTNSFTIGQVIWSSRAVMWNFWATEFPAILKLSEMDIVYPTLGWSFAYFCLPCHWLKSSANLIRLDSQFDHMLIQLIEYQCMLDFVVGLPCRINPDDMRGHQIIPNYD